uniref:Uncharacterized protein n=1 Tax=Panagrolaimus sp. ES5 TaxID=591445 RepID=A0AC34F7T0_9BILA
MNFKENDNVTLNYYYHQLFSTETSILNGGFLIDFSVPYVPSTSTYGTYPPSTRASTAPPSTRTYGTYPPSTGASTASYRPSNFPNTWFPSTTITSGGFTVPHKNLICLSNGGQKTCASNDRFCAYLSGTYKGTKTQFQGCSADLNQQTGMTVCTVS